MGILLRPRTAATAHPLLEAVIPARARPKARISVVVHTHKRRPTHEPEWQRASDRGKHPALNRASAPALTLTKAPHAPDPKPAQQRHPASIRHLGPQTQCLLIAHMLLLRLLQLRPFIPGTDRRKTARANRRKRVVVVGAMDKLTQSVVHSDLPRQVSESTNTLRALTVAHPTICKIIHSPPDALP
jgi:hypothetical protein